MAADLREMRENQGFQKIGSINRNLYGSRLISRSGCSR